SVAVGAARIPDLLVGVYDIFPRSPVIDGVLGTDFLGRYRITFDPAQRIMHLAPGPISAATPTGRPPQQADTAGVDAERSAAFIVALAAPPVWKPGDEWAYSWRSTQGSGTFVWSVLREEVVDGIPLYVVKSGQRELLYRRSDLALYLERSGGTTQTRFVPPL